ncbi:MAG: hypothetical protein GYA24_24610 [Candidatus Lokiarchaeota archaeon]|nr:hypothetical protein [Candidatus Lokiarchaeota archaeon]
MLLATYPFSEVDPTILFGRVIQQTVVLAFVYVMAISFWLKYATKKKTREVLTLSTAFTLLATTLLAGTIPMVLALVDPASFWIYGLPVWPGFQLWWTNLAYITTTVASFLILLLTLFIFKRPHKFVVAAFGIFIFLFDIWIFQPYGGVSVWAIMNGIPMGAMFFGINFTPWIYLLVSSEGIRKKTSSRSYKHLLGLFSAGALSMIVSYFMFGLRQILASRLDPNVVQLFDILYWTFFVLTAVLVYLGYASPEFYVNWLKRRYDESG